MTDINTEEDQHFVDNTLIEAIQNQIDSETPPATKATFNKLTLIGWERDDILDVMAQVLAVEIDAMLEADRPFDSVWYETALRALPTLPEQLLSSDDE
ncbi:hypothetical protein [Pseudomonas sp. dw_358]|uniref:hypothetical protein n=1 Tax=Pseudomonas sp. dw_358 TaxID=2720083 RepID=UPI001BD465FF|nr:hypothetical protein [Pseudomonas sp. dw_358]